MKLFLLKTLLQRRDRDEGFTLPMVIALGLVMLLLGVTNIVKSGEENLNATIQNSSSDALAVAEVGITKYRELLNQNRILTLYNHDQWDINAAIVGADTSVTTDDLTCDDMTSAPPGWTGTATKPNDTAATATDAAGDDDDNWWEIREDLNGDGDTTDNEDLVGKYRLVSYEYDIDGNTGDGDNDDVLDDTNDNGVFSVTNDANINDDNDPPIPPSGVAVNSITDENDTDDNGESNAVGILTVQGQSTDGSEAQIQVDIPLRINPEDMQNLAPVLWVGNRDTSYIGSFNTNVGTITIPSDSNIVRFKAGCSDPGDIGTNSVVSDARGIPLITSISAPSNISIPDMIDEAETAGSINTTFPTTTSIELGTTSANPYVTPPSGVTFDKDVHCKKISDCRYYYNVTTSPTDIDGTIETDGIAKVILYVNANLNIKANILGSSISSNYLEIYVAGNRTITIDSSSVNTVNAFIHAPDSQLSITGTGTVNITGSVWVDEFYNTAGATVNFGEEQPSGSGTFVTERTRVSSGNSAPSYSVYTTTNNRTPRPLTGSPTNWVKEEVE